MTWKRLLSRAMGPVAPVKFNLSNSIFGYLSFWICSLFFCLTMFLLFVFVIFLSPSFCSKLLASSLARFSCNFYVSSKKIFFFFFFFFFFFPSPKVKSINMKSTEFFSLFSFSAI